jgi:hypothetical protein
MSLFIWVQLTGLLAFLSGFAIMLIAAFRTNWRWGIGYLLIPFSTLIFSACNWHRAKHPLLIQILGLVILFAGIYTQTPPN